jgi:exonuclease SbcD
LAREEGVDAALLAGDLYDKPIPPAEAVGVLDGFLTGFARMGIPVLAISGNHDGPERLDFGTTLLAKEGVSLAAVYRGAGEPVVLEDEFGPVRFYQLPYLRPALLRHVYPEAQVQSYAEAVAYAVDQWQVDENGRNVLLAHQFVTGAATCESEEHSVGGVDQVPGEVFRAFDYVALGHLHGPQSIGRETLRYSGSPLKYSFSECRQEKSVTLVTLGEKGAVSVETRPLVPLRDLREIRGSYDQVTARSFYQDTNQEDYLHVILTDEEDVPEAVGKLRAVYPNLMKLSYDNLRTQSYQEIAGAQAPERRSPLELFGDLYTQQNNQPMSREQVDFLAALLERLEEGRA